MGLTAKQGNYNRYEGKPYMLIIHEKWLLVFIVKDDSLSKYSMQSRNDT